MYGTVARMKVKPGMLEKLKELTAADTMAIPGLVSTTVYQMDADSDELYLAVAFQDRDSYMKNADSPEQNQRYEALVALLQGAPEWHDGEIVYHQGA
jgi:quinol monooxygenase YgiN